MMQLELPHINVITKCNMADRSAVEKVQYKYAKRSARRSTHSAHVLVYVCTSSPIPPLFDTHHSLTP
jgi:hypothetical protein